MADDLVGGVDCVALPVLLRDLDVGERTLVYWELPSK